MQLTLHPSQDQQSMFFSKRLPTSLSSLLSFSEFGACLAQNIIRLKSIHNPEWYLKGLSEAISTKSLGQNEITKTRLDC